MDTPGLELLRRSYILALSPEEQEEALIELGEQLFTRLIARALDILPAEDQQTLAELLEQDTELDTVIPFLTERIPNLEEIASEEATALAEDRLALLPDIKA